MEFFSRETGLRRNLQALAHGGYDLIVVGGGIFGVCAAWDAVNRGLSVALVERGDFAGAASANSFRIVHGGIRYLQHADLSRIRASCRERRALLRIAPHLVTPLPIVIPTYGHGKDGKGLLRTGMRLYDLLTWDRNRGVGSRDHAIPAHRGLTRAEVLDLFPNLLERGLTGGAVFSDGQMYNPTRLAWSFLRAAAARGAQVANYLEATRIRTRGRRVAGVAVRDVLGGQTFEIEGAAVLIAAGAWTGRLAATAGMGSAPAPRTFSRDLCFVVDRRPRHGYALAVRTRTSDPDAILSRSGRHLFIVPWRRYTLIGVWHKVHTDVPDSVAVSPEEIAPLIDEINAAYPALDLRPGEISQLNYGLVPFGENQLGAENLCYGKRSSLIDYGRYGGAEGLVGLIGVRYTMARGDAAAALDCVMGRLDRSGRRPDTDRMPVWGAAFGSFEALRDEVRRRLHGITDDAAADALAHNYGSEYRRVLEYGRTDPGLLQPLEGSTVLAAEIVHAVREEMAVTLADAVFRRTDLGTGGAPGGGALQRSAALMAEELGWDEGRVRREIDGVRDALKPVGAVRGR